MSSTDLRIMLNNIQFSLGLTIGLQGEWSLQADQKLMELLAKPKRAKRKAAVINAIADAPQDLKAIRDELTNDNDIAHPEVAVDEPADTNNKPAEKDTKAVQDELTSDNDIAHPEVTVDEPAEATNEPPAKANAKSNPEANDDSDSNSSYSSSSSSSLRVPPNIPYNDRMTWPSDFADAYTCGLDLLEASGNNKIHNSFMNMSEVGPKDYIEHCGREVQRALRPKEPSPNRLRILPSSPSSDDNELPATVPFSVQLAPPDMPRKRLLNSSAFVYPSPARRLSRKTSVIQPINQEDVTPDALTSSAAPSSGLAPIAHALRTDEVPDDNIAPEPATSEAGDEMDVDDEFREDEEAAKHLGL